MEYLLYGVVAVVAFFAFSIYSNKKGIDKLTCGHGLALPDGEINVQYADASAHSEGVLRSKNA